MTQPRGLVESGAAECCQSRGVPMPRVYLRAFRDQDLDQVLSPILSGEKQGCVMVFPFRVDVRPPRQQKLRSFAVALQNREMKRAISDIHHAASAFKSGFD